MADTEVEDGLAYTPYSISLKTPRLLLRSFEEADLAAVSAYRQDAQVMRFITGGAETSEEVEAFLERTRSYAQQQPQQQYRFAIVLASSRRVIGGCGLDILDADLGEGEIGYHLHRDFWGHGIATETAGALLRFGFEHLKLHRIVADCAADNPASARVMQKAGMRHEAHFHENKRIGGQWHDTLLYAILERVWNARSGEGPSL